MEGLYDRIISNEIKMKDPVGVEAGPAQVRGLGWRLGRARQARQTVGGTTGVTGGLCWRSCWQALCACHSIPFLLVEQHVLLLGCRCALTPLRLRPNRPAGGCCLCGVDGHDHEHAGPC